MAVQTQRSSSSLPHEKLPQLDETLGNNIVTPTEPTPDDDVRTNAQNMPSPPRSTMQNVLIMTSICTATFLAALDTTILTTALPTIASSFHASDSGYAWIGSAYLLPNGTSMPFWGKISDIFGRKPILMIANAVFMAGSLIAALSKSLNMLLAGRVIQGLGAGGLMNLTNIVVSDLFSLRDRGLYLGLIGATWAFGKLI
jgi:MFS family permease